MVARGLRTATISAAQPMPGEDTPTVITVATAPDRPQISELTERDEVRLSARLHLGVIAAEEGRQEDAIALWQQVLSDDPGLSAVRMALASTFASMRRYEEAQDELRSVIAIEPENSQAHNLMARVRERFEVERTDTDSTVGVINDMGGGSTYLGMGFDWGRWL